MGSYHDALSLFSSWGSPSTSLPARSCFLGSRSCSPRRRVRRRQRVFLVNRRLRAPLDFSGRLRVALCDARFHLADPRSPRGPSCCRLPRLAPYLLVYTLVPATLAGMTVHLWRTRAERGSRGWDDRALFALVGLALSSEVVSNLNWLRLFSVL